MEIQRKKKSVRFRVAGYIEKITNKQQKNWGISSMMT